MACVDLSCFQNEGSAYRSDAPTPGRFAAGRRFVCTCHLSLGGVGRSVSERPGTRALQELWNLYQRLQKFACVGLPLRPPECRQRSQRPLALTIRTTIGGTMPGVCSLRPKNRLMPTAGKKQWQDSRSRTHRMSGYRLGDVLRSSTAPNLWPRVLSRSDQ